MLEFKKIVQTTKRHLLQWKFKLIDFIAQNSLLVKFFQSIILIVLIYLGLRESIRYINQTDLLQYKDYVLMASNNNDVIDDSFHKYLDQQIIGKKLWSVDFDELKSEIKKYYNYVDDIELTITDLDSLGLYVRYKTGLGVVLLEDGKCTLIDVGGTALYSYESTTICSDYRSKFTNILVDERIYRDLVLIKKLSYTQTYNISKIFKEFEYLGFPISRVIMSNNLITVELDNGKSVMFDPVEIDVQIARLEIIIDNIPSNLIDEPIIIDVRFERPVIRSY